MLSNKPSHTFFRLSSTLLFSLAALTWIAPWIDWHSGVQTALMGRVNNIAMLIAIGFVIMLATIPQYMRGLWERITLILLAVFITQATLTTYQDSANFILAGGGVLVIAACISAGLGAYSLGKFGYPIHRRVIIAMLLTLPALTIPPALIAWAPDAYPEFWINVYGYANVRVYGYFTALATVILSALALNYQGHRKTLVTSLHFLALSLSSSLLFWSGSRAGFVAVAATILFSSVVFRRRSLVKIAFNTSSIGIGLLLSTLYYTPGRWFGAMNRLEDTINRVEAGGIARASSNRIEMWQWGLSEAWNKPLWGHGYFSMTRLSPEQFNFAHTHNIIVEYLLSFGFIFGSIAIGGLIFLWVRAVIAAHRINRPIAQALLACVTLLAIYSLFSATLFFPFHSLIFAISLGALIGWDVYLKKPDIDDEKFQADAKWMFDDLP